VREEVIRDNQLAVEEVAHQPPHFSKTEQELGGFAKIWTEGEAREHEK